MINVNKNIIKVIVSIDIDDKNNLKPDFQYVTGQRKQPRRISDTENTQLTFTAGNSANDDKK